MTLIRSTLRLMAMSLPLVSWVASPVMAAECGPGEHWVDDCPAGTDFFAKTKATIGVVFNPNCDGDEEIIELKGSTTVERQAGVPHKIDTEIISMVLTGNNITLRAGVNEGVTPASIGEIVELEDPTVAKSSFDIFFEVDIPGIGTLHNKENAPHLMIDEEIYKVPPSFLHIPPSDAPPVPLYNEDDEIVACIVSSIHEYAIELKSFKAKAKNNGQVDIEWSTGTEENNASFQVWRAIPLDGECSTDPNNYIEVEAVTPRIPSEGTKVSGATYDYTDSGLTPGETYCYALSDEDYDGNTTYHLEEAQKVIVK